MPFVFCFCRLPRSWGEAIIRTAKWCPLVVVLAAVPMSLAGVRPLFVDSGGARLGGLGHPAFLASVCLTAIYACLIQLYRRGSRVDLWLLAANFLILLLTGARAPLAYAVTVSGLSLVSIRSVAVPLRHRLLLGLAVAVLVPPLVLLAGELDELRLFNIVANEAINLSGRNLLWPAFEAAADQSPWFGWGIGAGNAVIPRNGPIVQILHTWAAHNEYLRIEVEGGQVGRALLIVLFAAWVMVQHEEIASLRPADHAAGVRRLCLPCADRQRPDLQPRLCVVCVCHGRVRAERPDGGSTALAGAGAGGVGNGAFNLEKHWPCGADLSCFSTFYQSSPCYWPRPGQPRPDRAASPLSSIPVAHRSA